VILVHDKELLLIEVKISFKVNLSLKWTNELEADFLNQIKTTMTYAETVIKNLQCMLYLKKQHLTTAHTSSTTKQKQMWLGHSQGQFSV